MTVKPTSGIILVEVRREKALGPLAGSEPGGAEWAVVDASAVSAGYGPGPSA